MTTVESMLEAAYQRLPVTPLDALRELRPPPGSLAKTADGPMVYTGDTWKPLAEANDVVHLVALKE